MKVSIVVATRNRAKLLIERSLPSITKQTFKDFEVILIDDASDEVVIATGENTTYYRNLERKGLAHNRNKGVEFAKGEYVVSLDDDNEFHSTFLEETVKFLDKDPEYDAVGVGKIIVYPEGKVYQPPPNTSVYCSINDGFLIRRQAFWDIKCDEELVGNEDADFGLRFLQKYKLGRIDKPLMTVYGSGIINKTSYSDYSNYHLSGLVRFWLKNNEFFNDEDSRYFKKMIGRMFLIASDRMPLFNFLYWLEQKVKRYYQIWKS